MIYSYIILDTIGIIYGNNQEKIVYYTIIPVVYYTIGILYVTVYRIEMVYYTRINIKKY